MVPYTIYNGVVAIQGDSRQYRDAKGADRKESEGGSSFTSQNQMQKQVEKGTAPKGVDRVDKPHTDTGQPQGFCRLGNTRTHFVIF